jgi:Protein of unknown function (DUF3102)
MSALALPDLAERIEGAHRSATRYAKNAIEFATICGQLLLEAKAQVAHGQWLPWVDANLSFGHRQAQKYMRLAEHPDALSNANSNALLTIDSAIAAIARPTPKPQRRPGKLQDRERWEDRFCDTVKSLARLQMAADRDEHSHERDLVERDPALRGEVQRASILLYSALGDRPRERSSDPFQQPPPGRPRLDLASLDAVKRQYLELRGVDRNAFARWVMEDQLRQTDLSTKQKAGLAKVLEALTDYGKDQGL